jgi:hypothetical protein
MNYPDLIPATNVSDIIKAVPPSAGPDAATAAQVRVTFEHHMQCMLLLVCLASM